MTELQELERIASTCTRCPLSRSRTQVVFGTGSPTADLMFIGEGPGRNEDLQGQPFVGAAGQLLNRLLAEIGIARADVYIANVVKCRPPGNRDPLPEEIERCSPYLSRQVKLVDPKLIVTLGNFATRFVLDTPAGITRVRGKVFNVGRRTVLPTFHPAAVLRGGGETSPSMRLIREDFATARRLLDEAATPPPPPEPPFQPSEPVPAEQMALFA